MRRNRLILIALVALAVLWRVGVFDQQLAGVGLNAHPCGVTAIGTTVCGQAYSTLHSAQKASEAGEEARHSSEAKAEEQAEEYAHVAGEEARRRGLEVGEAEERARTEAQASEDAARK